MCYKRTTWHFCPVALRNDTQCPHWTTNYNGTRNGLYLMLVDESTFWRCTFATLFASEMCWFPELKQEVVQKLCPKCKDRLEGRYP